MTCNHEQIRCTNNVFYCLKCGAQVAPPHKVKDDSTVKENAPEGPKKAVKRAPKKAVKRAPKKKGESA